MVGTAEAAMVLGVNRSTITRMVQRGELTPIKQLPGGTMMFDAGEVRRKAQERLLRRHYRRRAS